MKLLLAIPFVCTVSWAGQSVVLSSSASLQNSAVPNIGTTAVLIEGRVDNWTGSESGIFLVDHAYGVYLTIACSPCALQVFAIHATVPGAGPIATFPLPTVTKTAYFRIQSSVASGNATYIVEMWDYQGIPLWMVNRPFYQGVWPYNNDASTGISFGGVTVQMPFYRASTTTVPPGSRPPQTSSTGNLVEYRFEGNGNDTSGTNTCSGAPCNLTASGSPTYTATANTGLYAAIGVSSAPTWTRTPTLRIGQTNTLVASWTASQADSAVTLACTWSSLSGPSTPSFGAANACTTTISNLAFGEYSIQLQVTDSLSNVSMVTATLGAAATDANSILSAAPQDFTDIYGKQIAWGWNPWGYADWLAELFSDGRYNVYNSNYALNATWPSSPALVNQTGTVSFSFVNGTNTTLTGVGTAFNTTLCSGGTPIANRSVILHIYRSRYQTDALMDAAVVSCSSDTSATIYIAYDPAGYGASYGQSFSSVNYSYADKLSAIYSQSNYALNFYGEDSANWQLYYRTGRSKFLQRALMVSWVGKIRGACSGAILFCAATGVGMIADALLDTSGHALSWADIRPWLQQGRDMVNGLATSCAWDDSRNSGWLQELLALGAWKDPDTTSTNAPGGISWRAYWLAGLSQMATTATSCAGSDYSWASAGSRFDTSHSQITMTDGSATATGNIYACYGVAAPSTGTAVNGSGTIVSTGISFPTNVRLVVSGTKSGHPYTEWRYYTVTDTTHALFDGGATWQGDSGTIRWMVDSYEWPVVFGQNANDPALAHNFSCYKQDTSTVLLMRPWSASWDGPAGAYYPFVFNVPGKSQQPYMQGIFLDSLVVGSKAATAAGNTTLANTFTALASNGASWAHDAGFDITYTSGTPLYGVMEMCSPATGASMANGVCFSGDKPIGAEYNVVAGEELSPEMRPTFVAYGNAHSWSPVGKDFGDRGYGNQYGVPGMTANGFWMHPNPVFNETSQFGQWPYYTGGKWFGLYFGAIGRAGNYPAERLAGATGTFNRATGGKVSNGGRAQ